MPIKQCKHHSPSDVPLPQNPKLLTGIQIKQSGLITLQFVQEKEQVPGVENPVLRQEFPLPQDTNSLGTVS